MLDKDMSVKVKNVTEGKAKYVVAKLVNGELWYYNRWENKEDAEYIAKGIDGLVVFDETAKEPKAKILCPHCQKRELTEFDLFMNFCPLCMKSLKESE